jgi:hypothetical protein
MVVRSPLARVEFITYSSRSAEMTREALLRSLGKVVQ